jgi:hypothetical protein
MPLQHDEIVASRMKMPPEYEDRVGGLGTAETKQDIACDTSRKNPARMGDDPTHRPISRARIRRFDKPLDGFPALSLSSGIPGTGKLGSPDLHDDHPLVTTND